MKLSKLYVEKATYALEGMRMSNPSYMPLILESNDSVLQIKLPVCVLGVENLNRRVYPKELMQKAIDEARPKMERGELLCTADDHPPTIRPKPIDSSHLVVDAWIDDIDGVPHLFNTWEVLDTSAGKNLKALIEGEAAYGVSIRGLGVTDGEDGEAGTMVEYEYLGTDAVGDPSAELFVGAKTPNVEVLTVDKSKKERRQEAAKAEIKESAKDTKTKFLPESVVNPLLEDADSYHKKSINHLASAVKRLVQLQTSVKGSSSANAVKAIRTEVERLLNRLTLFSEEKRPFFKPHSSDEISFNLKELQDIEDDVVEASSKVNSLISSMKKLKKSIKDDVVKGLVVPKALDRYFDSLRSLETSVTQLQGLELAYLSGIRSLNNYAFTEADESDQLYQAVSKIDSKLKALLKNLSISHDDIKSAYKSGALSTTEIYNKLLVRVNSAIYNAREVMLTLSYGEKREFFGGGSSRRRKSSGIADEFSGYIEELEELDSMVGKAIKLVKQVSRKGNLSSKAAKEFMDIPDLLEDAATFCSMVIDDYSENALGESRKVKLESVDPRFKSKATSLVVTEKVRKQLDSVTESAMDLGKVMLEDTGVSVGLDSARSKSLIQYADGGNSLQAIGKLPKVVDRLDPGVYSIKQSADGIFFDKKNIKSEEIIKFEDSRYNQILEEVNRFWAMKSNFEELGLTHKRGVMMYGTPGAGKTCLIVQLVEDAINNDTVVFYCDNLANLVAGLKQFKEVEEDRNTLVILEDVDSLISYNEQYLLELMDGDNQMDGVMIVGTTNYIDRIPPRVKRPGRFDTKIEVMPPPEAGRKAYFSSKLKEAPASEISNLVKLSEDFTFAQMRELLVSTYGFNRSPEESAETIRNNFVESSISPFRKEKSMTAMLEARLDREILKNSYDLRKGETYLARIDKEGTVSNVLFRTMTSPDQEGFMTVKIVATDNKKEYPKGGIVEYDFHPSDDVIWINGKMEDITELTSMGSLGTLGNSIVTNSDILIGDEEDDEEEDEVKEGIAGRRMSSKVSSTPLGKAPDEFVREFSRDDFEYYYDADDESERAYLYSQRVR